MMYAKKKSIYLLATVIFMYSALVVTHGGEFWPFSIYPMFSVAGKPWTKALVRDATNLDEKLLWHTVNEFSLVQGKAVALNAIQISQDDLSNFISKTEKWDTDKLAALRTLFSNMIINRKLLIYIVRGNISNDRVVIKYIPFILLTPDKTIFNPGNIRISDLTYSENS